MNTIHQATAAGLLAETRRLLEHGADIEALDKAGRTPLAAACLSQRAGLDIVRYLLENGAGPNTLCKWIGDYSLPVIALAVQDNAADCEKIRLLIEHGADIHYRSANEYTLLIWAACGVRSDVIDLLLEKGAPINGESTYHESALSVLSHIGHFEEITKLLSHGADPTPLEWTPLHRAVALGTSGEIEALLNGGADLEAIDFWKRTAFLIAIHSGDIAKAKLLLKSGADRNAAGHYGKPPMHFPLDQDNVRMLRWLIEQGFEIDQEDKSGQTALVAAAQLGAPKCFRALLKTGAEWCCFTDELRKNAEHPEIVAMLYELSIDLAKLEPDVVRDFIGLGTTPDLPVTKQEYLDGRFRRYGSCNPQHMDVPYWNAMVRCGWTGYQAASQFDDDDSYGRNNPVWSHDRFGMSLTRLPDGRFIQIAGEHEDHYDPDFCIYNDVFFHDGKGNVEILTYPADVFPPTDFHSATLVLPWIYIIGNLGYPETRETEKYETPVFRLHVESGLIERVSTRGKSPGWIHEHNAIQQDGRIQISEGRILTTSSDGETQISDHQACFSLNIESFEWRRIE